jgi:hypothetical protein
MEHRREKMSGPVFELVFEETIAGFAISAVPSDPTPLCELNEGAPADQPRVIIRNDQKWNVNFRWRTSGSTTNALAVDWHLSLHLLRLNTPGAPILAGSRTVPHDPEDPHSFDETISVEKNKIPDGLYKLHANVDVDIPGAPFARVTGCGEGPMMEFYTPS